MYLIDSGAQYKDGTTDVTRTLHFGIPTEYEKECFTRVLKGKSVDKDALLSRSYICYKQNSFAKKISRDQLLLN